MVPLFFPEPGDSVALGSEGAVVPYSASALSGASTVSAALVPRKAPTMPRPRWHAPWKLYRVISGHLGWVRCCTVEPGNEWFATGK